MRLTLLLLAANAAVLFLCPSCGSPRTLETLTSELWLEKHMPFSTSRELWLRSDGRVLFAFSATNYEGEWVDVGDVRIVVLR